MKIRFEHHSRPYSADLSRPLDISIPFAAGEGHARAWYVDPVKIEPVRTEQFTGSVAEGGSVNFRDIWFNPHGHGTHTECVGHIAPEVYNVNEHLKEFFAMARLLTAPVSVLTEDREWMKAGDHVIAPDVLDKVDWSAKPTALVIRTLPNTEVKLSLNYSATNPPYLLPETMEAIRDRGIEHLLIDLPSVDREHDEGRLTCHHIFWEFPHNTQFQRTITEFVFAGNHIPDGLYLLEMQVAPFENDASPSRPVLYGLEGG